MVEGVISHAALFGKPNLETIKKGKRARSHNFERTPETALGYGFRKVTPNLW